MAGGSSLLGVYLQECRQNEPLPPQDEERLLRSARTGDTRALQSLVKSLLFRTAEVALLRRPEWLDPYAAVTEAHNGLIYLIQDTATTPPLGDHLPGLVDRAFRDLHERTDCDDA